MNDKLKDVRPAHLRQFLSEPVHETREDDGESGLPSLSEGQYEPHARPSNKQVHALHFVKPDGRIRSFAYADLRSRCEADSDDFSSTSFKLAFLGMKAMEVTVSGRCLWRLYDYIHQHRMTWVTQAVRDFSSDGDTIVTAVSFKEISEEKEGRNVGEE